jgi:NhaP-type Na+/H+ or K+/H+ antiporter
MLGVISISMGVIFGFF